MHVRADSNRSQRFLALHRQDVFVMPNAWDAGSAKLIAAAGFPALGTTSTGIAYAMGYRDSDPRIGPTAMLDAIGRIVDAVDVPVSADLEAGFGTTIEAVVTTIRRAIDIGCAGGSLEDIADYAKTGQSVLMETAEAVDRVRAACGEIKLFDPSFVLTARTECYLTGHPSPLKEAIKRLAAFRDAGASCLYAPGISDPDDIATLVKEVGGAINVLAAGKAAQLSVSRLAALGVRRISTGSGIARAVFATIDKAAREIAVEGTFSYTREALGGDFLDRFFAES